MRRLGHPRFRVVCPMCRRHVSQVSTAHVWDKGAPDGVRPVTACADCSRVLDKQNRETLRQQVANEVGLQLANEEYFDSMQRSSNRSYLAACERMRREGW